MRVDAHNKKIAKRARRGALSPAAAAAAAAAALLHRHCRLAAVDAWRVAFQSGGKLRKGVVTLTDASFIGDTGACLLCFFFRFRFGAGAAR